MKKNPKFITRDNYFKVGDKVAYSTYNDPFYDGDQRCVLGVIDIISKEDINNVHQYKINLISKSIWVNRNKIRKLKKGEQLEHYKKAKYEAGQEVYTLYDGWDILSVLSVIYNDKQHINDPLLKSNISYICENEFGCRTTIPEHCLYRTKSIVEDSLFEVGDSIRNRRIHLQYLIKEVFTLDNDPNIYYKASDYNSGHVTIFSIPNDLTERWSLCHPPLVIFSEIDPYGEEDWSEE